MDPIALVAIIAGGLDRSTSRINNPLISAQTTDADPWPHVSSTVSAP
jgi:hypothetical protein